MMTGWLAKLLLNAYRQGQSGQPPDLSGYNMDLMEQRAKSMSDPRWDQLMRASENGRATEGDRARLYTPEIDKMRAQMMQQRESEWEPMPEFGRSTSQPIEMPDMAELLPRSTGRPVEMPQVYTPTNPDPDPGIEIRRGPDGVMYRRRRAPMRWEDYLQDFDASGGGDSEWDNY